MGGEPLLGWTLRYLAHYGFTEVALNLHYKPEMIRDYCGEGSRFGVCIHYSDEPELLGTAGAVKRLEGFFGDEDHFLVVYGDLLIDQDLRSMLLAHKAQRAMATLLLHRALRLQQHRGHGPRPSNHGFVERPEQERRSGAQGNWVNSGLQILRRDVLSHIPDGGPADLPADVYAPLAGKEPLFGFPLTGYRCAIDSLERYEAASEAVREGLYRPPAGPRTATSRVG